MKYTSAYEIITNPTVHHTFFTPSYDLFADTSAIYVNLRNTLDNNNIPTYYSIMDLGTTSKVLIQDNPAIDVDELILYMALTFNAEVQE